MSNNTMNLAIDSRIEKYAQILKDNPNDLSALMSFAEANLRRGKRLAALSAYQRIIQVQPDTVEARLALAKIYFTQNFHDAALEELKRVFELDPVSVEGHLIYREMVAKLGTTPQWAEGMQQFLSHQLRERDVSIYQRQLEIEQWQIGKEIQGMENILETKPDLILEYQRNMAIKRRNIIKNLISVVHDLMPLQISQAVLEKPPEVPQEISTNIPLDIPLERSTDVSVQAPEKMPVFSFVVAIPMEKLHPIWDAIKKSRGVIGTFLINTSGEILRKEEATTEMSNAVTQMVVSINNTLQNNKDKLIYWVAEYEQGLVVLTQLTVGSFLIVLGDKGVNFGALRLALDKGRKSITSE